MDPKLKSFLDLVAWSEGTSTSTHTQNDGYDVVVSGVDGPEIFNVLYRSSFCEWPPAEGDPQRSAGSGLDGFGALPAHAALVGGLQSATAPGRFQRRRVRTRSRSSK